MKQLAACLWHRGHVVEERLADFRAKSTKVMAPLWQCTQSLKHRGPTSIGMFCDLEARQISLANSLLVLSEFSNTTLNTPAAVHAGLFTFDALTLLPMGHGKRYFWFSFRVSCYINPVQTRSQCYWTTAPSSVHPFRGSLLWSGYGQLAPTSIRSILWNLCNNQAPVSANNHHYNQEACSGYRVGLHQNCKPSTQYKLSTQSQPSNPLYENRVSWLKSLTLKTHGNVLIQEY